MYSRETTLPRREYRTALQPQGLTVLTSGRTKFMSLIVTKRNWAYYERHCRGKIKHKTLEIAQSWAGIKMQVYTCKFCGSLHVGHGRGEPLNAVKRPGSETSLSAQVDCAAPERVVRQERAMC